MKHARYTLRNHNTHSLFFSRLSYVHFYDFNRSASSINTGHPYARFIITIDGSADLIINNHRIQTKRGDVTVVQPGPRSFAITVDKDPVSLVSIGMENLSFDHPELDVRRIHADSPSRKEEILQGVRFLETELKEKNDYYQLACSVYIQLLLIEMIRHYDVELLNDNRFGQNADSAKVKDYIDEHYMEDLTLDILAEKSQMSKYYLVHSFTKNNGCSPISYLNEKRIEESKRLLEETTTSIADIARKLGFSSQSYFSQAFKKKTLMTPIEYRRSAKL